MRFLRPLLSVVVCFAALSLSAQKGNPAQAAEAPLEQQFEEMLDASNRFQRFKVVRQDFLNAFMANVKDSLATYTDRIEELEGTIATQAGKIDEQAATIITRQDEITDLQSEKDSINLLGMPLSKTAYSLLMWSIVGVLFGALLLLLARMRLAVSESRAARAANEQTTAELEASRKSRLAVEQKLSRQLQDERNKRLGGS